MTRTRGWRRSPGENLTVSVNALLVRRGGGPPLPIGTKLRYEPADPYAVHVFFHNPHGPVVEWHFARELLAQGLRKRSGPGDVQVTPTRGRWRTAVAMSLTSSDGHGCVEFPRSKLRGFLRRTYALVPAGMENLAGNFDAELDRMLDGPTV